MTSPRYWKQLSNIEWRPLLYDENAPGIPLLLDLKARIEEELKPDLLLVDSRTGFTELGAISTVLFADVVVSLFVHNRENLEGTRSMLRSIQKSVRPPGSEGPVEIVGVLSRVPAVGGEGLVQAVLQFMNEPAEALADSLSLRLLHILPSDPNLELREQLLVGGLLGPADSPLLAAYLRLCVDLLG